MFRVLIADRDPLASAMYRRFLRAEPSIRVLGDAVNKKDALRILELGAWELLLVDLYMPGAVDLLEAAIAGCPRLRVVMIGRSSDEQITIRALQAGAHSFLSSGSSAEEFRGAVRLVLSGRRYISGEHSLTSAAGMMSAKLVA